MVDVVWVRLRLPHPDVLSRNGCASQQLKTRNLVPASPPQLASSVPSRIQARGGHGKARVGARDHRRVVPSQPRTGPTRRPTAPFKPEASRTGSWSLWAVLRKRQSFQGVNSRVVTAACMLAAPRADPTGYDLSQNPFRATVPLFFQDTCHVAPPPRGTLIW